MMIGLTAVTETQTSLDRPPIPHPPFLVAGLGRAGRAAAEALCRVAGPELVYAWDANTGKPMRRLQRRLEDRGVTTWLGPPPGRREVRRARTIVKSPGVPPHASVIQRAMASGAEVIDELELGWRLSRVPMVAVTGTNGKSTVAGLLAAILAASDLAVTLAGNTEFGPPLSAAPEGLDWIVCEVSSFQLEFCEQLRPDLAVFTNVTPEHLGRHGTLERYRGCKRQLFIRNGVAVDNAVVNVDDAFGRTIATDVEQLGGTVRRVGFSADADYRLDSTEWDLRQARTVVRTSGGRIAVDSALPGNYNAQNLVTALAAADLLGVARQVSTAAISAYPGPPGRFEYIDAGQPFDVVVDFAHTPDGLEQFLVTVRAGMSLGARLTVVLGYGGRPGTAVRELGRLARQLSDRLVLSTSGFLGFPPVPCLSQMLSGARSVSGGKLEVVLDRRRAIEGAMRGARAGDVVVIPGRGALPGMQMDPRGISIPFDDREVAREILNRLGVAGLWPANRTLPPARTHSNGGAC